MVIGFWAVTVGWLLSSKVLPTFQTGSAPHEPAWAATDGRLVPVGWTVSWDGAPIGWALTESRRTTDGGIEVDNRLQCDRLPLDEMLPGWVNAIVHRSLRDHAATALEAVGRVVFDRAGRLRSFTSQVTVPSTAEKVLLEGNVTAPGTVAITFRAGDIRYETTRQVPDHAMLGDELSPQATLPGLYAGRRWTVPVYSPLRPGAAPLQILHAHVGGEETMYWGNRLVHAHVVTYREDPSSPREPRSRLWVDRSGRVLRHESMLLGAPMEFVRRTDAEAERLVATAALLDEARAAADTGAP